MSKYFSKRPLPASLGGLSRRGFLKRLLAGSAGAAMLWTMKGCYGPSLMPDVIKDPMPAPAWLANARVANFTAWLGIDDGDLRASFETMAAENVNVLEIDLSLYHYEPIATFDKKMRLLDKIAQAAHKWGMRSVAYYSTGEVITENAPDRPDSMVRDHPDWLQVTLDGTPVTFTGDAVVYWVAKGEESAWMCPVSGFADYYLERVRKVAATAVDGVWVDVPLFPDDVAPMPCTNASCAALFHEETGLEIPRLPKGTPLSPDLFNSATFRRWMRWRHEILHRWLERIASEVQAVRADCKVIVETVTCDNNRATTFGLDAAFADESKLYRVFEVSPLSDDRAMHDGWADDWIALATTMKFAQGVALPKPAWAFTYGFQPDDAEYVMGLAINAGVCPFEAKIPEMTQSVDPAFRARAFAFIADNQELYAAQMLHSAAVVQSSASRDFLDRSAGLGLFYSEGGFQPNDSAAGLPYQGDYRGCCRALMHAHVPYTVLPETRIELAALSPYKLVVLPSAVALSDAAIAALSQYASGGGTLLFTGPDAGSYDLLGALRASAQLISELKVDPAMKKWQSVRLGAGLVLYHPDRVGLAYLKSDAPALLEQIKSAATQVGARIDTDASPSVLMDLRRSPDGKKLYVLCTSLVGLGTRGEGGFAPQSEQCSIRLPLAGFAPSKVVVTSLSANTQRRELPVAIDSGSVTLKLSDIGALLVATLE